MENLILPAECVANIHPQLLRMSLRKAGKTDTIFPTCRKKMCYPCD